MTRVLKARRLLARSTLAVALCMTFTGMARATSILQTGFDLFKTPPGSSFDFPTVPNPQTVTFQGNLLGTFDFGSGPVNVGQADTIVERVQDAGDAILDSDTIDIEIVALSLVSVSPIDLGFGAGFEDLFITLNTSSPSLQSNMTLNGLLTEGEPHGTFDSLLNFSFDVVGSVGGFYATIEKTFTSSDNEWQHAPTGLPLIDDINHLLNAGNESNDFWPSGLVLHDTGGGQHSVIAAPEPGTAVLLGVGLVGLAARRRRKR